MNFHGPTMALHHLITGEERLRTSAGECHVLAAAEPSVAGAYGWSLWSSWMWIVDR